MKKNTYWSYLLPEADLSVTTLSTMSFKKIFKIASNHGHGDSQEKIPEKIVEEESEDFKKRQRRRSSVPHIPQHVLRRVSVTSVSSKYREWYMPTNQVINTLR